jgi:hypothetical protein
MLEEFLMQILEKGGLNNLLLQQDRTEPLHFLVVVQVGLSGSKLPQVDWQRQSYDLALNYSIILLQGYMWDAVYVLPLHTNLPQVAGRI